jgi:hypothetical protein
MNLPAIIAALIVAGPVLAQPVQRSCVRQGRSDFCTDGSSIIRTWPTTFFTPPTTGPNRRAVEPN